MRVCVFVRTFLFPVSLSAGDRGRSATVTYTRYLKRMRRELQQ